MADRRNYGRHKKDCHEDKCFPEIPYRNVEEVKNDLLESIALEETALANLMNAEARKICEAVKKFERCEFELEELIALNDSAKDLMKNVIKKEMLLEFKLEEVKELGWYHYPCGGDKKKE